MKKTEEVAIKVSNVSKSFDLPHEKHTSVKGALVGLFNSNKSYEKQRVLKDISFEIKKGEFFGIVGRNGSGKSTLLKLLAGIYTPDRGSIEVNGKLTPFIELGVGFNPELTGRENVFLNGALLGFSRKEMEALYDEIVEFAELEKFMDQKLKNYSSGMQVRLAFSIAIRAKSDILLLDEVLAVGDEAFQQKCYDYFGKLKRENQTVVLVTHDMSAVERFCQRGLLVEMGSIKNKGKSSIIANSYRTLFNSKYENDQKIEKKEIVTDKTIKLSSVLIKQGNKKVNLVKALEPFVIEATFISDTYVGPAICGINVINSAGDMLIVTGIGTIYDPPLNIKKGKNVISFSVIENIYNQDSYFINIALAKGADDGSQKLAIKIQEVSKFNIVGIKTRRHSLTHPRVEVEVRHGP